MGEKVSGSSLPRAAVQRIRGRREPSGIPPLLQDALTFRPLRSTVVTRFFATMGQSDSRTGPLPGLCLSLGSLENWLPHPAGSPRFLDRSVPTRRPLSPRRAPPVLAPITSRQVSGFIKSGRLAALTCVTRPNRVHLRYGSQVRRARLRQPDCFGPRSLGYLLNGQLTDQTPFSLIDRPDLSWRTGLHGFRW